MNILSVYAPTLSSSAEAKDEFYEDLETTIRDIPATEDLYLLGDFNARVGSDYDSWPRTIGHFGVGKLNENRQRLFELCSYHDLCITNTFFSTKTHHRVSWRHARSRHWHHDQLDFARRPVDPRSTASSLFAAITALTVTLTIYWSLARFVYSPNESIVRSSKDAHASTLPRQHFQTCVRSLPTPSKRPSWTVPQPALKRDGATSVMPSTTPPWTPLAREKGRTQTGSKRELLNLSQL